MIIKADVKRHFERVCEIERAVFKHPWEKASLEAEFYKDYSNVYVFSDSADNVIGYIIFWLMEGEAELISLGVAKNYQRGGVASKLIELMFDKICGAERCFLEVGIYNEAAIALYKKFGFEIVGTIKNYYGDGENAYRMRKLF